MPFRTLLRLASLAAVLGAAALAVAVTSRDEQLGVPVDRMVAAATTTDDLRTAGARRVFFAHQSVGANLLAAMPGLYAGHGLPAPAIRDVAIGVNGDPLGKVADFDARIRGGVGNEVDVALMKFCYSDIDSGTDVRKVFTAYRDTLAALQRDYPRVTFLHVTTPLTTDPGLRARVKKLLGRDPHTGPADNLARERMNELMRAEYPPDRLFDLAAVESTKPDGERSGGTSGGRRYFSLWTGYAADAGHLNTAGATVASAHLLGLIAHAPANGRTS